MKKVTILSSTNRKNSFTLKVAKFYSQILSENDLDAKILSLENLPESFLFSDTFGSRTVEFQSIIDEYISDVSLFVFIVPEYNGSFPGILKGFLDAVPPSAWKDKKAGLVGVAQGRAGNLRGIEQLTLVLNYLKVFVHYNKLPISGIESLFDNNDNLIHEPTKLALAQHKDGLLGF